MIAIATEINLSSQVEVVSLLYAEQTTDNTVNEFINKRFASQVGQNPARTMEFLQFGKLRQIRRAETNKRKFLCFQDLFRNQM